MKGFDDRFFGIVFYPLKFFQNNDRKQNKAYMEIIWNKRSKRAVFILPQWMGEMYYYSRLIRKLKKDYTVVLYKIPNKIISENADETAKNFETAKKDVIKIANSLGKKGYRDFSILGVSLTCSLALMVANADKRYRKIVLSLVGDDFAECFWNSKNMVIARIKRKMAGNGLTLHLLKKSWKNIAPTNNIKNLQGRNILLFLSKNDQLVKYEHGLRFINAIKKKKINYKAEIDDVFGHYIAGLKRLLFPNKIINFLMD